MQTQKSSFLENYIYYLDLLKGLDEIVIRGKKCKELNNVLFDISDNNNILFFLDKNKYIEYLTGELFWYLTADERVEVINHFSKFWNNISENGKCNSAYGNLLFNTNDGIPKLYDNESNQWWYAFETLKQDMYSRRAFMLFQRPRFQYLENKDIPCTMYIIFFIRDSQLKSTVHMRSSDIRRGIIYDIPFFYVLHFNMYKNLLQYYKDLELGNMTFMTNSLHLYDIDYDFVVNKDVERIPIDDKFHILYEDGKANYKKLLYLINYLLSLIGSNNQMTPV